MAKSKADLLDQIGADDFMDGYMSCLLFTEDDTLPERWAEEYGGDPEDAPLVDPFEFTAESLQQIVSDCKNFKAMCKQAGLNLEKWGESDAGHDFWLTRNGHGAGFWDRGRKDGDALTKIAESFGEVYVYMDEAGTLHYEPQR